MIQSPGGYQNLPAPPEPPEPGSAMLNASTPAAPSLVHRIQAASERIEMTVNSSRILTLDQTIPRAQVNNKDILELTPLSPNEIQVFAKKAGVTSINLWGEKGQVYTDRLRRLRRCPRTGRFTENRISRREFTR